MIFRRLQCDFTAVLGENGAFNSLSEAAAHSPQHTWSDITLQLRGNTVWHKRWLPGVRDRLKLHVKREGKVWILSWPPHYSVFENKQSGQTLIIYGFNINISGSINVLWAIHNPRIPDLKPGVSLACFYFRNPALFFCFVLLLKPLKINPCCQMLSLKAQSIVLLVGFWLLFLFAQQNGISYVRQIRQVALHRRLKKSS